MFLTAFSTRVSLQRDDVTHHMFVRWVKIWKKKETDKSTFKMAIWLSWTGGLHVREKLLPVRDIFRTLDEGKRLGDNLEREAEEINPGRLKRETRRWNEGFKGTEEFPEPCSRDGSTVTELQKITLAVFVFLVACITILLVRLFLDWQCLIFDWIPPHKNNDLKLN